MINYKMKIWMGIGVFFVIMILIIVTGYKNYGVTGNNKNNNTTTFSCH